MYCTMLDLKTRYLQLAFNGDLGLVRRVLSSISFNERIIIEAGTPFIKREGFQGIRTIASYWRGLIVADLKTSDGAAEEVMLASAAGASAATVLGSAPTETINLFIAACESHNMYSMIDMLGVEEPLKVIMKCKHKPDVVILHKGRDEETTRGKVIQYKHINKIKSKFDVLISAAGGVDLKEARSAIFNGANIVVVNLVSDNDPWTGIDTNEDVSQITEEFLRTIE
jgi:bifunctional enzyme Fae/Hps